MKKILIIVCSILTTTYCIAQKNKKANAEPKVETPKVSNKQINWHTMQELTALQKTSPKKVFVDVYTDWCGWCKVMDKNTFTDSNVIEMINKDYYAIKFNAEGNETIDFLGQTYTNTGGKRSSHPLAVKLLSGKLSYPSTLYLDEQLNVLTPVAGYLKPAEIKPILSFFGNNTYKTKTWEEYSKTK